MITRVFWEAYCQWRPLYLLFEEIFLVQEKDDTRLCEPFVIADGVEQFHRFHHPVLKRGRM